MLKCYIKGCHAWVSNLVHLVSSSEIKHWIRIRACRCGAWDTRTPRSCTCHAEDDGYPTSYWPNLDWFAFGGVEEVILCPTHKAEVMAEIARQRVSDPSMNSERQDRGNIH